MSVCLPLNKKTDGYLYQQAKTRAKGKEGRKEGKKRNKNLDPFKTASHFQNSFPLNTKVNSGETKTRLRAHTMQKPRCNQLPWENTA